MANAAGSETGGRWLTGRTPVGIKPSQYLRLMHAVETNDTVKKAEYARRCARQILLERAETLRVALVKPEQTADRNSLCSRRAVIADNSVIPEASAGGDADLEDIEYIPGSFVRIDELGGVGKLLWETYGISHLMADD